MIVRPSGSLCAQDSRMSLLGEPSPTRSLTPASRTRSATPRAAARCASAAALASCWIGPHEVETDVDVTLCQPSTASIATS